MRINARKNETYSKFKCYNHKKLLKAAKAYSRLRSKQLPLRLFKLIM